MTIALERVVKEAGQTYDSKLASIGLAQEALKSRGIDEQTIARAIYPLRELQNLRTKLDAHSGGKEAGTIRANLLKEFTSPRKHVENLCERLLESLEILESAFGGRPP